MPRGPRRDAQGAGPWHRPGPAGGSPVDLNAANVLISESVGPGAVPVPVPPELMYLLMGN